MTTVVRGVLLVVGLVAVGWLGARLLGVRRSWLAKVIAGGLGALVGVGTALALTDGGLTTDGFLRTALLAAFVATMAAAVGADLLARPGSLAKGEAAGLFVLPRPGREVRTRLDDGRRLREIVSVAVRNGFGPTLGLKGRHDRAVDPVEVRLRRTLEECGGMFVKLGQILSTRTDLLPPSVTTTLASLQSDVPPEDPAVMRPYLEAELGAPVDEVFAEFDWRPVGGASIAQAYAARLRTGEAVIVKAQRPGVAELVRRDSEVLRRLARMVEANTAFGAEYRVSEFAEEFTTALAQELDFRQEARNALALAGQQLEGVRVPVVFEEMSTDRVLVLERFDGPDVGQVDQLDGLGYDRSALAELLLDAELAGMLDAGVFHADPHPGNVIALGADELGLIDFGAVGRMDEILRSSLRDMLVAVVLRSPEALREAVAESCEISPEVDPDLLERALGRFLAEHVDDDASIDGGTVADLLQMLSTFGIRVPVELTTFARTLAVLEGTLRTLDPDVAFADRVRAFGARYAAQLAPAQPEDPQELVQRELIALLPTLRRLPRQADRLADMARAGTLTTRVSLFGTAVDRDFVAGMVDRVLLAFIGAVLGIVSVLLLAVDVGPVLAGSDVRLLDVLGTVGLLAGLVLLLRVAARIVRDGFV